MFGRPVVLAANVAAIIALFQPAVPTASSTVNVACQVSTCVGPCQVIVWPATLDKFNDALFAQGQFTCDDSSGRPLNPSIVQTEVCARERVSRNKWWTLKQSCDTKTHRKRGYGYFIQSRKARGIVGHKYGTWFFIYISMGRQNWHASLQNRFCELVGNNLSGLGDGVACG